MEKFDSKTELLRSAVDDLSNKDQNNQGAANILTSYISLIKGFTIVVFQRHFYYNELSQTGYVYS